MHPCFPSQMQITDKEQEEPQFLPTDLESGPPSNPYVSVEKASEAGPE